MNPEKSQSPSDSDNLSDVVQRAVECVLAGESIDIDALAEGNPELRSELQSVLPAIQVMANIDESELVETGASGSASKNSPDALSGVLGDFRLIRVIGRGGMGTVYEAEQLSLERPVALKVLPFASMLDDRQLRRFRQEARAAAMLQYPNIVRVFAVGCDRGVHHYAMELIEGENLAEVIKRMKDECGRMKTGKPVESPNSSTHQSHSSLPIETQNNAALTTNYTRNRKAFYQSVARLGVDVARALAYAHREGVVHRDIKPSNLLLDHQGKIWITDFGLAHMQTGEDITQSGDVLGTLRYMSPEQLSGEKAIDQRADIYSLGLTLYELAILQPAYGDSMRQKLVRHILESDPPRIRSLVSDVPKDLETILSKAISREPRDRYQTAEEFADDLQRFTQRQAIKARPSGKLELLRRWAVRNPTIAILAVAVTILLSGISVVSLSSANQLAKAAKAAEERLYVSDMVRVQELIRNGENLKATNILERYTQDPNAREMRAFEWFYLRTLGQTFRPIATLGHRVSAYTSAFSPKGKWLATSTWTGEISIWNVGNWTLVQTLNNVSKEGYNQRCMSLTFTPDGQQLVGACLDGVVRVWQVDNWERKPVLLERPKGLPPFTSRVVVSDDGQYLAVSYTQSLFDSSPPNAGEIRIGIWQLNDFELVNVLQAGTGTTIDLAFSPRNGELAATCWDGKLRVWKPQAWQLVKSIPITLDDISAIAFSPDGTRLATVSGVNHPAFVRGNITIWDSERWEPIHKMNHHDDHVGCVEFSPDGRMLATGSDDHGAALWDVDSGRCLQSWRAHSGIVHDLSFSHDGKQLSTASADNLVRVWDVGQLLNPATPLTILKDHEAYVPSVCFADEGGSLFSSDTAGRVVKRDFQTGKIIFELQVPDPVLWRIQVAVSSDNRLLAVATGVADAGRISVFEQETGQLLRVLEMPESFTHGLAFGPNSIQVAAASYDSLFVFDAISGDRLARLPGISHTKSVAFSPDGKELAAATASGETFFYETNTFKQTWKLRTEETWGTMGIAYAPDGDVFATGGGDLRIKLWDARRRGHQPIKVFPEATSDWILTVSFSDDGRRILSTGLNGTVRVWHRELGETVLNLQASRGWLMNGAFSPDGRSIAVGSHGIRIWKAADTFHSPVILQPPNRPCYQAFELDGNGNGLNRN